MSDTVRRVQRRFLGAETLEGAGVRLRRQFGGREVPLLDPFLLLDNFGSSDPADYLAGFPWHPHRGIDTVTYMLNGRTAHEDSLGHHGVIDSGDVQWMSSGHGILHQEMPKRTEGTLSGFQLWVNVPHERKLEPPAYRGLRSPELPLVRRDDGATVRLIAGEYGGVRGPVEHLPVEPLYVDVTLPPQTPFELPVPRRHTVFAHVIEGSGDPTGGESAPAPGTTAEAPAHAGETLLYEEGDRVRFRAGSEGVRFLLGAGRPLHEPVAWYGPIVMNTPAEIQAALADLRAGTFATASAPPQER
jgi:quercetin 2,3-dioxygenase